MIRPPAIARLLPRAQFFVGLLFVGLPAALVVAPAARAQMPGGPPAVGVVRAEARPVTESTEYVGHIQAVDRVDITARVTARLEERLFTEGAEVAIGDPLYRLERPPLEAVLAQQEAAVAEARARADQAATTLARVESLIGSPASLRSQLDDARANHEAAVAALDAAKAQARTARINLEYTDIRAPIAGKIGRANVSPGNIVGPSSGPLTFIVSQDPIYVVFSIPVRALIELRQRHAEASLFKALDVRIRLPDGRPYPHRGTLDYQDPSVTANTDTITLRAALPNPKLREAGPGTPVERALIDGAFVTVGLEDSKPERMVTVPRQAVLADVKGYYVWVIGEGNKAQRRDIVLGQSTPAIAVIASGLKEGETVVVDGVQRVRPDAPVNPAPANPAPANPAPANPGPASPPAR